MKNNVLVILYFNSFKKLKFLPEERKTERKDKKNEILFVHNNDLTKTIFTSLMVIEIKK